MKTVRAFREMLVVLCVMIALLVWAGVASHAQSSDSSQLVSSELLPQALKDAGLPTNPQLIVNHTFSFSFEGGMVWGTVLGIDFSQWSGLRIYVNIPIGGPGEHNHAMSYDTKVRLWGSFDGLKGTLKIY